MDDRTAAGVTVSAPTLGHALSVAVRMQARRGAALGLAALALGLHHAALGLHAASHAVVHAAHRFGRAGAPEALAHLSDEQTEGLILETARRRGVDPGLLRRVVTDVRERRAAGQ